jgi:hypothetical protein
MGFVAWLLLGINAKNLVNNVFIEILLSQGGNHA